MWKRGAQLGVRAKNIEWNKELYIHDKCSVKTTSGYTDYF